MSEKLGPIHYGSKGENVFLGREIANSSTVSEETERMIDQEIRAIIDTNYQRTAKILKENMEKLHVMAKALLEFETIEKEDLDAIMSGQPLPPKSLSSQAKATVEKASDAKEGTESPSITVDLSKTVKA